MALPLDVSRCSGIYDFSDHHVSAGTFLQNVVTFTQIVGSLHVGERFESCTGRFFSVSSKSDFYVNAIGSDGVEQFANCARVRRVGEK